PAHISPLSLHDALPISSTLDASDSAPVARSRIALLGSPSACAAASAALRSPSALASDTFASGGVPLIAGADSSTTSRGLAAVVADRKSTRLNSSHVKIS